MHRKLLEMCVGSLNHLDNCKSFGVFNIFNNKPLFQTLSQVVVSFSECECEWSCIRDIEFAYFYDFSIGFLELFRQCDIFFSILL